MIGRDPLSTLTLNANASSSSSASASSSSVFKLPAPPRKLAPIFIRHTRDRDPSQESVVGQPQPPSSSPDHHLLTPPSWHAGASGSGSGSSSSSSRKRVKLDHDVSPLAKARRRNENVPIDTGRGLEEDEDEEMTMGLGVESEAEMEMEVKRGRMGSMKHYFHASTTTTTPGRTARWGKDARQVDSRPCVPEEKQTRPTGIWRRPRRRFGMGAGAAGLGVDSMVDMIRMKLGCSEPAFLPSLVTSLLPYHPDVPPSYYWLPSHHSPTGRARDSSPPLCVAFNSVAKNYDALSAREFGRRRMIAIAGEEGGVRIFDVDEGLGMHREEKGWWWRAHANAVFDIKWSGDDKRILTASGDQTTRIHALTTPTPTLLATLNGHTSSIKTTVFFDPTRSHLDPSTTSSVVASGGRDGNILIYDLRCQGRSRSSSETPSQGSDSSGRSGSSERYRDGIPGFAVQNGGDVLNPVMTIKGAHGDGSRRGGTSRTALRSVTSLVALQAMPGVLASGGNYDGIVKLWDLRFPAPSNRYPDPRPSYTPMGVLADPTVNCAEPSRRPRSINALVESPTTGDLFALCGDSKIHGLRPAAMHSPSDDSPDLSAILPKTYVNPNLLVSNFYLRASISPDGKHLACGSSKGGLMTWDVDGKADAKGEVRATRLSLGGRREREVNAVDWGKDMIAACADDLATRIWRSNHDVQKWMEREPEKASLEWAGTVRE